MIVRQNPWQTQSLNVVYENPWIRLEHHEVINPAGKPGVYGKVCFKSRAVGVIPVDNEGNTWLVGQHRYTLNEWSWEIPEGGAPLKETPEACALRELLEETGMHAGQLQQIMRLHTSNSVTDEEGYVFLATQLSQGETQHEDTEDIEVWKLPLRDAIAMAQDGRITDLISIAALLNVALNAQRYGIQL